MSALSDSYGFFGVYMADSLSESMYRAFFEEASPDRRNRATRFLKREAACRTIVVDCLVRYVVKRVTGFETDRLILGKNEYGKPMIHNLDIHFNISHSGEWAICAIDNNEIGVDIESHRPIDIKIADRFFSEKEILFINRCKNEDERYEVFFKIWTLKESYIKSIGKGFSCPFDGFSCIPQDGGRRIEFNSYIESLPVKNFKMIDIDPHFSCAICGSEAILRMKPLVMTPESLFNRYKQLYHL